jgi:hypothetical protein
LATYDRWMDNCLIFVESANISHVLEDFKLHGDHINIAITIIHGQLPSRVFFTDENQESGFLVGFSKFLHLYSDPYFGLDHNVNF